MLSYFLCIGIRDKSCDLPRLNATQVQAAVEDHYATLQVPEPTVRAIHTVINADARERKQTDQSLRRRLKLERARLQEQQRQFLELVGNSNWPIDLLNTKMSELADQIQALEETPHRG